MVSYITLVDPYCFVKLVLLFLILAWLAILCIGHIDRLLPVGLGRNV